VAFALVVALGVSYLVYRQLENKVIAGEPKLTTRILVADHDLPVGTLIKDGDFKLAEWPEPAPASAMKKPEDALGRGVTSTIYAGEPLHPMRLAGLGGGGGLAATIPKGKRALAIRVNDVVGVAGFVSPGMRVDVLASGTPPNAPPNSGTLTQTVLQNIEVLSAGQNIQKDAEGKPVAVQVVNLLVSPEQAERLSLASTDARIQLVLRNPLDTEETKPSGTTFSALFGAAAAVAPVKSAPAPRKAPAKAEAPPQAPQVEIIVGSKKGAGRAGK
jgi:pilus assembly protein CpaB